MDLALVDEERIARAVGSRPVTAELITGRGYSNNRRMVVELANGTTVFVKQAVDGPTAQWLRAEYSNYRQLRGSFLPDLLGWADDGEFPLLALEDLSASSWPPPWRPGQVESVLETLAEVAAHPLPAGLRPVRETDTMTGGWPEVARGPEPLLSLGMCSPQWLERALPVLLDTADPSLLNGDSLLHLDVRSDNLCFRNGRAVLFDWNYAAIANSEFDIAFWLPSLAAEGGPVPEKVATITPGIAALVAGFFACRAGLPVIPQAPFVRDVQQRQLAVALPWAARVLDLPAPA